jgi:membrane-associated HD superfamily phosphohydrolase
MKVFYHATILNVSAGLYLGAAGLYGLFHFGKQSAEETVQLAEMPAADTVNHWSFIAVSGLLAIGAVALLADLFIQRSIRNRKRQNRIGLCIALLIAIGLLTLK